MALGGVVLNLDLHQRAPGQVRLHQVQWHDAKAEPCAQKVMLGREIAKTPYSRGQQPESAASPHTRKISVHELNMLAKDGHWNRRAVRGQWVLRGNHLDRSDGQHSFAPELRW